MTTLWNGARAAGRAVAWTVGAASLAAALLGQGGRVSPWLDLLTHFALVWLAGALLALACGLVLAQGAARLGLTALGLSGVLAASGLMAPELTRAIRPMVDADPARRLRLIQLNAWGDNREPEAAAAWIAAQKPDVVTVDDVTPRLREALVSRGFHYAKGMVGTAVFSQRVPTRAPFRVPFRDWLLLPDFARAAFAAPDGGASFTVVAAHFTRPVVADYWRQGEALARLLDRQPSDRLIIAGDFNLASWSFTLARLDRRLALERRDRALLSWPASLRLDGHMVSLPAVLPIDHIYAGAAWRTVRIARGPRLGSDHYPLIVDLALED
jgi:endonuclease/exonuclease/phosphatase (EEP) superfamily protein YafD